MKIFISALISSSVVFSATPYAASSSCSSTSDGGPEPTLTVQRQVKDSDVLDPTDGNYIGDIAIIVPGSGEDFLASGCLVTIEYKEVYGLEVDYSGPWPRVVKVPTDKTNIVYTYECD